FLQGKLPTGIRWLVPVLMTVWVMATIVFRGPAVALLIQFAPLAELPKAGALIVLVMGLVGALGPVLGLILKSLGASPTFILGAIALAIGASILYSALPKHTLVLPEQDSQPPGSFRLLSALFTVGIGAGLEINLLLGIFPPVLQTQLSHVLGNELISSSILLVAALTAVPLGELTVKLGVTRAMLVGLGAMMGLMGLTLLNSSPILAAGLILAFGTAFGLIFISQIPFALAMVPPAHAGLGTGLYFGGMGAATALSSILMKQPGGMTAASAFGWAAIAFLVTALCLTVCQRLAPKIVS
ncbi:MAG TPA: hypothetical protein V6C85_09570, partial [Allocoleopsis sp.]